MRMTESRRARFALALVVLGVLSTTVLGQNRYTFKSATGLVAFFNDPKKSVIEDEIILNGTIDFTDQLGLPLGSHDDGTCTPFGGRFIGNTIKNLVVNNTGKAYQNAGLFCELAAGAQIINLVLDESCSFTGEWAGAVSVNVSGPVTMTNVVVNAEVHGTERAGGWFATVEGVQGGTLKIEDGQSTGKVSGRFEKQGSDIGGFVGLVQNSDDLTIQFSKSLFSGDLLCDSMTCYMGGFIGRVKGSSSVSLGFIESESVGTLKVESGGNQQFNVGGFVGFFQGNQIVKLSGTSVTISGSVSVYSYGSSENAFGGFVGLFDECTTIETVLKQVNNTISLSVIGPSLWSGGLIGAATEYVDLEITIDDVRSQAKFVIRTGSSRSYCGGLIGYLVCENTVRISVSNCICEDDITVIFMQISAQTAGGVIGFIMDSNAGSILFTNISNRGKIQMANGYSVGGLVGAIASSSIPISIVACSFNGSIECDKVEYLSGFIGFVQASNPNTINVSDSTVSGNITNKDTEVFVSGFFSIYDETNNNKAEIHVNNCLNKATITGGKNVYGVSSNLTQASYIVNMGTMNTETPFWNFSLSPKVDSLFGLNGMCQNCLEEVNQFLEEEYSLFFTTDGRRLDDLLNQNAMNEDRTRFWTSDLSLVPKCFNVTISGALDLRWVVEENQTLGTIRALEPFMNNPLFVVLNDKMEVNKDTIVTENVQLNVYQKLKVCIGTPLNIKLTVIPHTTLGEIDKIPFDQYIVMLKDTNVKVDPFF